MKVQNQADICVKQTVWGIRKARGSNNLEPENTSDGLSKTSAIGHRRRAGRGLQ